jgi:hypothetical protein
MDGYSLTGASPTPSPLLRVCTDISLTPVHRRLHTDPARPPLFETQYTARLLDTHPHRGRPCDSLTTPACCGRLLHTDSRLERRRTDCVTTMPVPTPPRLRAPRPRGAALDPSFPSLTQSHSSPFLSPSLPRASSPFCPPHLRPPTLF